jgi:hypothetical protein
MPIEKFKLPSFLSAFVCECFNQCVISEYQRLLAGNIQEIENKGAECRLQRKTGVAPQK